MAQALLPRFAQSRVSFCALFPRSAHVVSSRSVGMRARVRGWVRRQLGIEGLGLELHSLGMRIDLLERRVGMLLASVRADDDTPGQH